MMDFAWTLETPTIGWIINRIIPSSLEHLEIAFQIETFIIILQSMIIYELIKRLRRG